jgi:hypothetical protein
MDHSYHWLSRDWSFRDLSERIGADTSGLKCPHILAIVDPSEMDGELNVCVLLVEK